MPRYLLSRLPLDVLGLIIAPSRAHRPQGRKLALILYGEVCAKVACSLALQCNIVVHVAAVSQTIEACCIPISQALGLLPLPPCTPS